jgi:hypothetical protein
MNIVQVSGNKRRQRRRRREYAVTANMPRNTHALFHEQAKREGLKAGTLATILITDYLVKKKTIIKLEA